MSIDARVETVYMNEDGSGRLALADRSRYASRGQPALHFDTAPEEVTALNGLEVWGGSSSVVLGDVEIANRLGYSRIKFKDRDTFIRAVSRYHEKRRQRATNQHKV